MADDIQPEILRRTQESLGKYIKKPVLSEKLLRKPPFRFLHDICTAVMKETGFLEDTLSGNDVKIELITDKEGKIAFLQKVIAAVEAANNTKLAVKPNKIVAGHEPIKTNEFLQALAFALEKQLETKAAKKNVKKTKTPTEKKELPSEAIKRKNAANNKPSNKTSEQPPPADPKKEEKKRKSSEKKPEKEETETKKRSSSKDRPPGKVKEKKKREVVADDIMGEAVVVEKESSSNVVPNGVAEGNDKAEEDDGSKAVRPVSAKYKKRSSSARPVATEAALTGAQLESELSTDAVDRVLGPVISDPPAESADTPHQSKPSSPENSDTTAVLASAPSKPDVGPTLARKPATPSINSSATASTRTRTPDNASATAVLASATSRKAATPLPTSNDTTMRSGPIPLKATTPVASMSTEKSNGVTPEELPGARPRTAIRPPSARPASARPAAPRVRDRGQVPLQEQVLTPAGRVNLIIEQDLQQDDEELVFVQTEQLNENVVVESGDTFSAATDGEEHGQLVNQILEAKKELEEDVLAKKGSRTDIEWSGGRGIEAVRKEVEKGRSAVQGLTRAAHPLGKLLEYMQDDVDSMQHELHDWRARNQTLSAKLELEKNLTDKSIEPLKTHLEELEENIKTESEQIGALKATILRNNDKINRLLSAL